MPQDDAWDADASREIARSGPGRPPAGYGAVPDEDPASRSEEPEEDEEELEEIEVAPVRRQLSLAIAGFSGLLALALALGAQTSAPDHRLPYTIILFGIQLLYLLAWIMALHPPAAGATAGVCVVVALAADYFATTRTSPGLFPLFLVAVVGFVAAVGGQLFRAEDRRRVTDSWRTTLVIVAGVVAYAIPVVLTRQEIGTQTIVVSAAGAGVALLVARVTDAIF